MKITRIEPTVATLTPKKKVAAYARVSVESDRLNHSLSAQVSYYSNLIQKNPEWIYVGVYADSGISGGDIRRRTEFKRLVEDCDAGKIDIILCKSISRFARNTVDLLETVRYLKSLGIDVWFEKENIQSLSADGELMLGILAGFAEEESRSQSDNAKWSIRKKFERGEQWQAAAYGYRWDGKSFVICEEEANAIRVIYDNFLRDVPLRQTSRWLESHGYACSMFFIRYVLQNMVYVGDVLLQRYITENPRTHRIIENKGQLPRYYITDNHPAIIDPAVFEMVQREMERRTQEGRSYSGVSIFSGKIRCGECGGSFGAKVWHSTDKYRRTIYRCNNKYNGQKCQTPHVTEEEIKEAFVTVFNRLVTEREEIIESTRLVRQTLCNTTALTEEKAKLQQELAVLVEMTEKCVSENARIAQNQEEYRRHYEGLVARYDAAKARFDEVTEAISAKEAQSERLVGFIKRLKAQTDPVAEFNSQLWASMVEYMTVGVDKGLTVVFRDGTGVRV